ncbi:L-threonine O-3-phosphate decarboxylase [Desulfatibacillum alkenivorans DSM 16219]|jgi:threonine-phosphate decarboxylase|uniref:L-threonine O-3-phosphate decarboxylase n=1 Tax=Desulfatibacillum alkenivorans DSM 16219 TaxID=1121393 RepID=A0A1M6UA06_9BACT|nr:threonine-phosphate decarboxylase [Desulfatibacillum alkenivorans]SHK65990.1 L-threonine O-3-phosphate decarboxylase [Desulfatibacillum alkenivorans DSM 16219]
MIAGHGGNIAEAAAKMGLTPSGIMDMSSNTNPLGPMPGMLEHLKNSMDCAVNLPEADAGSTTRAFADLHGMDPAKVLAAGGTTQFIYSLPRILSSGKALVLGPTYADYADACAMNKMPFARGFTEPGDSFKHDLPDMVKAAKDSQLVFLCNPNNPTGDLYSRDKIQWTAGKCPGTVFVVDESYLPFVRDYADYSLAKAGMDNVIVLSSFSKIFKVPGLRIGFAISPPRLKEKLEAFQLPWSVGSLAQKAVQFALDNREDALAYIAKTAEYTARERKAMEDRAARADGLTAFPGATPFVLFRLPEGLDSQIVWQKMLEKRLLIRNCSNFQGLGPAYVRISLKDPQSNARAADLLASLANDFMEKESA